MGKLHAGLDVADKTTAICVMEASGKIVLETSVTTEPKAIAAALKPYQRVLTSVGQETGTKSTWLHKELTRRRLPMICLDARHAKAALAAKPNKTDKNDARGLATLLCRGHFTTAHVKSDEALRIQLLLTIRKALQRKALDLQMSLHMTLKTFGVATEKKRRKLVGVTRTRRPVDAMLSRLCPIVLRTSDMMLTEVKALDKLVARLAADDPVCRRLMVLPGVGPITALTFRAAVDDPTRFQSSRMVAAYFGLTPRRYQSGQMDFRGGISKHGDPAVRTALYSAACVLLRLSKSQSALRSWGLELARRRGFKVAAVACARKLAVIMHRIWVTGEDFEAKAVAK
jgi:transposase